MTKNELAEQVASSAGLSASQAREALEAAIETISKELAGGGEVALAGFGKFSVSHRAARQGRNPSTGETISIAASNAAKFSAASALKKRLNLPTRAWFPVSPAQRGPVSAGGALRIEGASWPEIAVRATASHVQVEDR
jgi:DNA-binding protein HU-beta